MKERIKVTLENVTVKEYYELEKILKRYGIETEFIMKETDGTEMGFGFNELIILLPLLTPIIAQLRKAFEAYLDYKKPLNQKISVTLEKQGKKLQIKSENNTLPSIEEFTEFFNVK